MSENKNSKFNNMRHKIDLRTLGDSGMNIPFIVHNTSGRLTMERGQSSSIPVINKPEDKIVGTGYAQQLLEHTYDVVIENDSIFIGMVKKYGDNVYKEKDNWTSLILMVHDIELNQLVHYEISKYRVLGNKFGMMFTIDENYLDGLRTTDTIPEGTRLSWSNNTAGDGYKTGVNLNMFVGTLPESGEDCTLLSDDKLDALSIDQIESYEASYGRSSIMANVHGDESTYKAFPDIGDIVKAGDILFSRVDLDLKALKNEDFGIINNAMLFTTKGLMSRRPHFTNNIIMPRECEVIDIDIYHNPKTGECMEGDGRSAQTIRYLAEISKYHSNIIHLHNEYTKRYGGSVSPDTTNLIVDAMTFLDTPIRGITPKVDRRKKRSKLDMYTVKITVRTRIAPNTGYKITGSYGDKGVVKIMKKEDMPRDANGVVADIAVLSKGVVARTNEGKLYEQYFTASSRQTKKAIKSLLAVDNVYDIDSLSSDIIENVFQYLRLYLKNFDTTQYKLYCGLYNDDDDVDPRNEVVLHSTLSIADKREILKEIHSKELYLIYNASEEAGAYDILNNLEDSEYRLNIPDVFIKDGSGEFVKMKSRAIIAPIYMVLLNKTTDDFLGGSTFFLNGYGFPTGKAKGDGRFPYKFKNVKGFGESEMRLLAANTGPKLAQTLADRSRSIVNHKKFYRNQLECGNTTSENLLHNRSEDTDVAVNLVQAVIEASGIRIHEDTNINKQH